MPEFTGHRDIRSYIRVIWRWKLLIVVLVVGAPVVAYLLERGKPNQYSATATVSPNSSGTVATTGTSVFQTDNIDALSQLITTSSVATVAGAELKPPQTGSEAVDGVSTSANEGCRCRQRLCHRAQRRRFQTCQGQPQAGDRDHQGAARKREQDERQLQQP